MPQSTPTTWDEASMQALEYIIDIYTTVKVMTPVGSQYDAILDSLASFVNWRESSSDVEAVCVMIDAGCMAMKSLVPITLGMDKTEQHRLLCRKQHDYGHGNIAKFGLVGIAVRMCDKIERAVNLTKKGGVSAQITEPLKDAFEDIIGYAVIGIMLHRNTFMLPLDTSDLATQNYMPQQFDLNI